MKNSSELSQSCYVALQTMVKLGPHSSRYFAAHLGISSQAMATRMWRLRQLGLALKEDDELYSATDAGKKKVK